MIKPFIKNNKGMTTMEVIFLLPLCIVFIIFLMSFGILYYNRVVISNVVSMTALDASNFSAMTEEEIVNFANARAAELLNRKTLMLNEIHISSKAPYDSIEVKVTAFMDAPIFDNAVFRLLGDFNPRKIWEIDSTRSVPRVRRSMVTRTISYSKEIIGTSPGGT